MDQLPNVLRSLDGPYALAGLALIVIAAIVPRLMQKLLDQKARRLVSFSLLALGGLAILGSLMLAAKSPTSTDVDAASRSQQSISIQGQGNVVGNGNVMGNGNTIRQAD